MLNGLIINTVGRCKRHEELIGAGKSNHKPKVAALRRTLRYAQRLLAKRYVHNGNQR